MSDYRNDTAHYLVDALVMVRSGAEKKDVTEMLEGIKQISVTLADIRHEESPITVSSAYWLGFSSLLWKNAIEDRSVDFAVHTIQVDFENDDELRLESLFRLLPSSELKELEKYYKQELDDEGVTRLC